MGHEGFKPYAAKGKWVQRPNRKIIKSVSGTGATWHVTGLLSNRVISYLQAWHRISCSRKEADPREWKVPGVVVLKNRERTGNGKGERLNRICWNGADEERSHMESVWKKIRQVTESKMLWFSRTHTKCLPHGGPASFSEVRQSFTSTIWVHVCYSYRSLQINEIIMELSLLSNNNFDLPWIWKRKKKKGCDLKVLISQRKSCQIAFCASFLTHSG